MAICLHWATGLQWVLVVVFWCSAAGAQGVYAKRLNAFLGGADPVGAFRSRNLKELRMHVAVPSSVIRLNFLARAFGWAGLVGVLFAFGWLEMVTVVPPTVR